MPSLDQIRTTYPAAKIASCRERDCELRLDGLRTFLVLKGERLTRDRRVCDCIVFAKLNRIVVVGLIELKHRIAHASEVREKLINASEIAFDILRACGTPENEFEFIHVVLATRWSSSEYRAIVGRKLRIRGQTFNIRAKGCGTSFRSLISSK